MFLKRPPRRRKNRQPHGVRPPPAPPAPVPANVILVTGSFGDTQTLWHFDRAIMLESGATFEMFTLHEEGGPEETIGVSGVLVGAQIIQVVMNVAPQDYGNGWFYDLASIPPKVKTTDGASINAGLGDLTLV